MTTLDHRMVQQRIPAEAKPPAGTTVKYIAPPLHWREVLANDALAPDATKHKAEYLARQASRRWLGDAQRATETMNVHESRRFLAGYRPFSSMRHRF